MIRTNLIIVLACVLSLGHGLKTAVGPKAGYEFVCHQIGVFPHAYDCTIYFMCVPDSNGKVLPEPITYDCNSGYAFDPETHLCSARKSGDCPSIVGSCSAEGDMGPIVGSKYMYYKCLEINGDMNPQILQCDDGKQFIDMDCRDPLSPSGLDVDGKCIDDGQFANHEDCRSYNVCVKGEEPETLGCNEGEFYNGWMGECEQFQCSIM